MDHSTHTKLLFLSVAFAAIAMVAMMIGTVLYSQHLSQDRLADQVAACERLNNQGNYINALVAHHPDFELSPIVISDCASIIK